MTRSISNTPSLLAFGNAIREIRKEKGISQETLANQAEIDRSHMGKIERGERNLTFNNILKIAQTLGCRPSDLFDRAGL